MNRQTAGRVATVREFNRFYTKQIGALRQGLLGSSYSLTQVRILYELAHHKDLTATDLRRALGLDAGQLSRLLARFEQQGLVERVRAKKDGRHRILHLTPHGRQEFAPLNRRASAEVVEWLRDLSEQEQRKLLQSMRTVQHLLQKEQSGDARALVLRPPGPGDLGWVVHRHGALYAQEYGWNAEFDALVAQVVSDFITHFKPERERCWIAEMDGEIVGSVFCVQADPATAKLRLLLVEPHARGLGLGARLVQECIDFARRAGYKKLVLWTNSVLVEARHLYEKAGFKCVAQDPHHSFGHDLIGEHWELALTA